MARPRVLPYPGSPGWSFFIRRTDPYWAVFFLFGAPPDGNGSSYIQSVYLTTNSSRMIMLWYSSSVSWTKLYWYLWLSFLVHAEKIGIFDRHATVKLSLQVVLRPCGCKVPVRCKPRSRHAFIVVVRCIMLRYRSLGDQEGNPR